MKRSSAITLAELGQRPNTMLFITAYPQLIDLWLTPEEWVENVHSVNPGDIPLRGSKEAEQYRQFLNGHKGPIPFTFACRLPSWTWDIAKKFVEDMPTEIPWWSREKDFYLFVTEGIDPGYYEWA